MNSISQPRRRPRRKSVTFKTLAWLLTREAVRNMLLNVYPNIGPAHGRFTLIALPTYRVRRLGERLISEDSGRRFYP